MKKLLALLLIAAPALAGANLNVTANAPAQVLLDGQEVGQTPASLPEVPPGFHEVRVVSVSTGEARTYDIYSPARATLQKDIAIQFQGVQPPPVEDVAGEAPGVDPDIAAEEEARRREHAERNKVRTRNALLGTAAVNEIFNKGKSKKVLRGVSLGGALLNELIKR